MLGLYDKGNVNILFLLCFEDDISMPLNLLSHGIGSLVIIRLFHVFLFVMHLDGH